MATYLEQIAAFEAKRASNVATMKSLMDTASEKGETLDADAQDQFDELEQENAAVEKHLTRLKAMHAMDAATAKPVDATSTKSAAESRSTTTVAARVKPKLEKGVGFARLAKVKALAKLDGESVREVAKHLYGEDSEVYGVVAKAAVPAGTTTGATWAGPLVGDETSIFADFVEFLRPQTIMGRFGTAPVPSLRRVPFRTALIGQTSGGDGYWVGEGQAKPLTKFDFSRTVIEPTKVANIAVVTEETLRNSSPSAELIVRDQLAAALRERLDIDFINPAKAAVAGVSPASILNGVTGIASSGNTADDVRADIAALFGAFIAANNAPTSGVWIMQATTALALGMMVNPLGQFEFPGVSMTGGTLQGLLVIVSQHVPAGIVALVNASDIYLADEGGITVDMSREASLQMDNAPTMNSTTPTGTSVVSMFQTNSVAFRAEREVGWARRRADAVAYLTGVAWGAPAASQG